MASDRPSSRIVSSTLSLGAFSVICMALGLGGTVIITRQASAEDFGIYTLILVFVSFLCQISAFGLELSVSKFIAAAKDKLSQELYFSTAVFIRICSILLTSLLAWFGSPLLKMLFGQSLLPGFLLYVPLLFSVESLRALLRATLQGGFLFSKMGITDLIQSSMNFVLIILIFALHGSITLLILARAFSAFLACIYAFISIPIKKRISFNATVFRELMKFGYPLQINDILLFIYSRIDTIAVAVFLGPVDIATYEVARKIPDYLNNLYSPFNNVYFPNVSKRYSLEGRDRASTLMNDSIRFVTFVTLLGTVIAILFGREILQWIFTQKYSSSAPLFVLFMVNLGINLVCNVMGFTLVAVGDTKKPAIINFFNAGASLLGSYLLTPVFGLIGACVGNTIGTSVAFPLNRYFVRKHLDMKDAPYLKPIVLFCVWGALVFILKPESLLIKIAFLLVFLLACGFLSVITKKDIALLIEGSGISSWPQLHNLRSWISKL